METYHKGNRFRQRFHVRDEGKTRADVAKADFEIGGNLQTTPIDSRLPGVGWVTPYVRESVVQ